jgi:hypothetical protein
MWAQIGVDQFKNNVNHNHAAWQCPERLYHASTPTSQERVAVEWCCAPPTETNWIKLAALIAEAAACTLARICSRSTLATKSEGIGNHQDQVEMCRFEQKQNRQRRHLGTLASTSTTKKTLTDRSCKQLHWLCGNDLLGPGLDT